MESLLNEIRDIYTTGGTSTRKAAKLVLLMTHCFHAMGTRLTDNWQHNERLHRWQFYISDEDEKFCLLLEDVPKQVLYLGVNDTAEDEASIMEGKAYFTNQGRIVAEDLLAEDPNFYACMPLMTIKTQLGDVHYHMWREDLVLKLSSQLDLHNTPVPFKVLRRLRRTGAAAQYNKPFPLRSIIVVGGLICWECGAMPSDLKQCGGCGVAWYCNQECRQPHWHRTHKQYCATVMQAQAVDWNDPNALAESQAVKELMLADCNEAIARNPDALALV